MADIQDTPEMIQADAAAQQPAPIAPQAISPIAPAPVAPQAVEASIPEDDTINVFNPQGDLVSIPKASLPNAVKQGFKPAQEDEVHQHFNEEKYGGLGQQLKATAEGAAKAATFGLSTAVEKSFGVKPEDIRGREETGPGGTIGQIASLAIPFAPEAMAVNSVGHAVEAALPAATTLAKIGSSAAKGAVETALVQGGDEVSKMLSADQPPANAVETAVSNMGLAGLLGGALGGGVGAISPLWKATGGQKVNAILNGLADRAGGIEGQLPESPAVQFMKKTGMEMPPELGALISGDKDLNAKALNLLQTDTNRSGIEYQKTFDKFKSDLGDMLATNLGRSPEELPTISDIDKYSTGKSVGDTLAKEYDTQLAPSVKGFEEYSNKYEKLPLEPSVGDKKLSPEINQAFAKSQAQLEKLQNKMARLEKSGDVEGAVQAAHEAQEAQTNMLAAQGKASVPGTTDTIAQRVNQLAEKEGWTTSPSSDVMKLVNTVAKEIPALKTLGQLKSYISQVNDKAFADPLNGPLKRAGGMINSILKDQEGELLSKTIGEKEGAEAYGKFAEARKAYAAQSKTKEYLDSVLHAKGSTSGYGKAIRTMAQQDGEKLLQRLSGKSDADLLDFLSKNYPETSKILKDHHINDLLASANEAGKINPNRLAKSMSKMSPQLRSFIASPEQLERIQGVSDMMEHLKEATKNYNYSNSGRLANNLLSEFGAGATNAIGAIAGHSPFVGAITGYLGKAIGKDIPDAYRLALLKKYGSTAPVNSQAFVSMAQFIDHTIKAENMIGKATKNLFKAGAEVLPQSQIPTANERAKLDKQLKAVAKDPMQLKNAGGDTGHYMPEHSAAMAMTATQASTYLNSIRPQSGSGAPLDSKLPPNPMQKAQFDNALDIATQPLLVLNKISQGRLNSNDLVHLQAMYPNLYTRLRQQVTDNMSKAMEKGDQVPYKTRIGLSLFLAQPMDSTLTGESIIAAQPQQAQAPQMQQPGKPPASSSVKGISKLPETYRTPSQVSDERRATKQ